MADAAERVLDPGKPKAAAGIEEARKIQSANERRVQKARNVGR